MVAQRETLSVVDNRTGKAYELAITDGAINATDLSKIKSPTGAVTRSFDPAYMNTVNCISRISFINGEKGILEYRGYPIEQLAEKSNFLETAFLVIYGELPNQKQLKNFSKKTLRTWAWNKNRLEHICHVHIYTAHTPEHTIFIWNKMLSFLLYIYIYAWPIPRRPPVFSRSVKCER